MMWLQKMKLLDLIEEPVEGVNVTVLLGIDELGGVVIVGKIVMVFVRGAEVICGGGLIVIFWLVSLVSLLLGLLLISEEI